MHQFRRDLLNRQSRSVNAAERPSLGQQPRHPFPASARASFADRLMRDTSGNVAVMAALCLPVLLGAAGLGVDTIQWTLIQRQLQRQADSAAIAGALAKAQGTSVTTSANRSLARDNLVSMTAPAVIENAPTQGPYAGNAAAVRVVLTSQRELPFSAIFLPTPPRLRVEATAAIVSNGTYCIISTETNPVTGITLQGSATVDLGCGLATNSPAATAINASGSAMVIASPVAAVGGIPGSRVFASGTVLLPHTLPQRDPFAHLANPSVSGCGARLSVSPNSTRIVSNPAGSSCYRGMDIKGTANFAPGIYYIDGDSFSLGSQARVTGTNVVFVLTSATAQSQPASIATVNINGGAQVSLTAPNSGPFSGLLFYQDRRAPNVTSANLINGNAFSKYEGSIYFPSQAVSFSGSTGMNTRCLQIVARRVTFIGNAAIENDCPSNSSAKAFIGTRVLLVA